MKHASSAATVALHALDSELATAWEEEFRGYDNVEVICGDIFEGYGDAIVSPANSFGFMDGGLDLKLSQRFGWGVEDAVRDELLKHHDGELPVGCAIIVATKDEEIPYLISAPTMRVPMDVSSTVNSYLAFRGVLRAVRDGKEPISRILCPGLGTGEGRMKPKDCARQMREAYDVCIRGRPLRKGGLAAAVRQHLSLLGREL